MATCQKSSIEGESVSAHCQKSIEGSMFKNKARGGGSVAAG